jgi:hypothetical protein
MDSRYLPCPTELQKYKLTLRHVKISCTENLWRTTTATTTTVTTKHERPRITTTVMRCKIRLIKLIVSQLVRKPQFLCNFKFISIFTLAQNYALNRFTSSHIPTLVILDLEEEVTSINGAEKRYCYTNLIAFW